MTDKYNNYRFNKVDETLNECVQTVEELTEALNETNAKIEAILNIIDIRIQENKELAILHYPEPEDNYINEYESRADELIQLKKLSQHGR